MLRACSLLWCLLFACLAVRGQERAGYDRAQVLPSRFAPPTYRPVPLYPAPSPADPEVILVPRLGLVRGTSYSHGKSSERTVHSFLGLRYGLVRPGLGRFQKASLPPASQRTFIDATREGRNCPQFPDLEIIAEAETRGENVHDCLTLNVHAPNVHKAGSHPVLVYIHGEMLFDGSAAEAQPEYFLAHDVVLVSVNYRLAPFGFLSTLTDDFPGNVALADIQMALEWIQNYIRPFGGDPTQVTLMGQAGGAVLVHALALSGKAEGLFHKLILQSGTALNPYFLDEHPIDFVRTLANSARCAQHGNETERFRNCFERLSTTELLRTFKRHWDTNEKHGLLFTGGFKLSIGDRLGYLPQHPAKLVANNTYPMIAGAAKDAGAFILTRFYDQLTNIRSRNLTDYVNVVLTHTALPRHHQIWRQWALQHIFSEENPRNANLETLAQGLLELVNLILYRTPLLDSIRYTYQNYPTYLYVFDYRGQFHRFATLKNNLPFEVDATLSDDNIYLFPYPEEVTPLNTDDKRVANTLVAMWVNFATSGAPDLGSGSWPTIKTGVGPLLRFTNSKQGLGEIDYHFGEGIPIPNLYPEYFTTTTTTTTTTTRRPYLEQQQQRHSPHDNYWQIKEQREQERLQQLKRRKEEIEAWRRAAEEQRRAAEEKRRVEELEGRTEEEKNRAEEEKRRAEELERRAEEEKSRAEEEQRREEELERRAEEEKSRAEEEERREEELERRAVEEKSRAEEEERRAEELERRAAVEKSRAEEEERRAAELERRAAVEKSRAEEEERRAAELERRAEEEQRRTKEEERRAAQAQPRRYPDERQTFRRPQQV